MPVAKKTVKKVAEVKTVKKTVEKKAVVKPVAVKAPVKKEKVEGSLTVALFDNAGKEKGTVALPTSLFGGKINEKLMAQAVRVYLTNQRVGNASTKSRGEVTLTTAKWYRQKGTGRARHGAQSAPIFVGGGVAHGPKPKNYELSLPKKMRKAAVVSALSLLAKEGRVKVVAGLTDMAPKTKNVVGILRGMGLTDAKTLLVMPSYVENVFKAARNVNKLAVSSASSLNTYEVLNSGTMIVMKEALENMEKMMEGKK